MTNGCDESAFMRISRISLWNLQAKDDNPGPTSPASTSQQAFLYPNYSISNLFSSVSFFWGQGQVKGFPYVSMVGCLLKGKRSSFGQGALSLHNERARVDKPIQASSTQFAVSTHLEIFTSWFAQLIKLSWAGWLYVAFTCLIFLSKRNQIRYIEDGVKVLLWIAALREQLREEVKLRSPPQEVGQAHRLKSVDGSTWDTS